MSKTVTHVVVIDDDADVRSALALLLRASAFDIETYGSAKDFLDSLDERTPQCLIVDLQMPGMTGLELHRSLTSKGINIPTIVITAHDEGGTRERCRSAGVANYLVKPLHRKTLIAAINEATGQV